MLPVGESRQRVGESDHSNRQRRTMRVRFVLGISVCILLATILWFGLVLTHESTTILRIPLRYGEISEDIGLEGDRPDYIEVTLSGKNSALLYRWMRGVEPVKLPMPDQFPSEGRIQFSNVQLVQQVRSSLGTGLQVRVISPDQISLRAYRLQSKRVPLVSHIEALPASGYVVRNLEIQPDMIQVYAGREQLSSIREVHTEKLQYRDLSKGNFEIRVPLEPIKQVRMVPDSATLKLSIEELTEKCVELPISAINAPEGYIVKFLPTQVSVRLAMSMSDYDNLLGGGLGLIVDLAPVRDKLRAGDKRLPNLLPVEVHGAPEWVTRVDVSPKAVQYILELQEE